MRLPKQTRTSGLVFVLAVTACLGLLHVGSTAQDKPDPAQQKPLTAEQQEKLKERDRLNLEVTKLRKDRKIEEAIGTCEKMLSIEREVFDNLHDDVVGSLKQLAKMHERRSNLSEAKKLRTEVLQIQVKRYEEKNWRVCDARRALANVEFLTRITDENRSELERAAGDEIDALGLDRQGKYSEAADLCRKVLATHERILGKEHPSTLESRHRLGIQLSEQANYAGARPHLEEALAIRTKILGIDHPETASSLDSLGLLLRSSGEFEAARPYLEKALSIRKSTLGVEHRDTAFSLNNVGSLRQSQGDYAGARLYLEQAVTVRRKTLGPEHASTATSLSNLGLLLELQGDYAGARPLAEEALTIRTKALGPEHPNTALSLNNLGSLYSSQGDYAAARVYYEKALAINNKTLGPEHPRTAINLNNLGELHYSQGDYTSARPYFGQALATNKKMLGPEHRLVAVGVDKMGKLLSSQKDYASARLHHEQALAIYEKALGPNHPETTVIINNLGHVFLMEKDYAGARLHFERALMNNKQGLGPDHLNTAGSLSNLGYLLQMLGNSTGARSYHGEALSVVARQLDLAAAGLAERQQQRMAIHCRHYLDAFLSTADIAQGRAADMAQSVLRWKGAVLTRQRARLFDDNPNLTGLLNKFQSVCRRLSHLSFAVPGVQQRESWRESIEKLTREKEALEVDLASRSEAFKRQQELRQLSPDQLRKSLPAGTTLIDFLKYTHRTVPVDGKGEMRGEWRVTAFVVQSERPIVQVDLGPLTPITTAVDDWRKNYGADDRDRGERLRRLVWEPLEAHLKDAQTILISPDGALARFPFAALPGNTPGNYLIEERNIAVVPVPQLLPELLDSRTADTAEKQSLLLVGDVDFGAAAAAKRVADARTAPRSERSGVLQKWGALPGTRPEVVAIKETFQNRFEESAVAELREAKATEHNVRQQAPKHRYLHFATHGFFAPPELKSAFAASKVDTPLSGSMFGQEDISGWHPGLLSGLVLAGANQPIDPERDDGILTALEVASLDLSNVELAVLSACETGLGEVAGGEGLLGLQRAFQTAGARSVVAGLWKVPDKATQMLMTKFYENLWDKKMSKLEALRQAQIWMLREVPKDEKLREDVQRDLGGDKPEQVKIGDGPLPPYFWAGFVLSGDWR